MTTLLIDYKAGTKMNNKLFEIDRDEYPTVRNLEELAWECMNKNVYLIRVFDNENELFTIRNRR